ncbi:hypothetical protein SK128_023409 [Halocaridina rubra]|uniref:Uncharacterized protein n=1 Tax=Halocaridina rubra TaxID=373956 RepID=A0AAN9AB86_HALRR
MDEISYSGFDYVFIADSDGLSLENGKDHSGTVNSTVPSNLWGTKFVAFASFYGLVGLVLFISIGFVVLCTVRIKKIIRRRRREPAYMIHYSSNSTTTLNSTQ